MPKNDKESILDPFGASREIVTIQEKARWLNGKIVTNKRKFQIFVEVSDKCDSDGYFPCVVYDVTTNEFIEEGEPIHKSVIEEYFQYKKYQSWIIVE